MPISISSPSRNLFLLGSVGGEVITNFFRTVDKYDTAVNPNPQDYTYGPTEIRYNFADQKFLLAGTKISGQTDKYEGWIEKRTGANADSSLDNQLDTEIGISGTNGDDVQLLCMELDNSNNILAAGKAGDVPFVARYSNAGGLQWQSTTNSGDVIYTGLAVDSNDNIYAAGSLVEYNGNTHAFIEKFDSNGTPGWGKSAYFLGNICGVRKIAANSRGEVVAVGTLNDDDHTRGYIVKIDTATGEVKWDKTLESGEGMPQTSGTRDINCEDVFIDTNDQIYIVGRGRGFTSNIGFIIKMTAEGNIIWQKQTPVDHDIAFWNVKSDGETEQTIVLGDYRDTSGNQYGLLSKYAKNGDLVWRRVIYSSYNNGDYYGNRVPSRYGGGVNLDADPSFYYLLASDEEWNIGNSTPKSFHFGKVSTSGNGLGNFEYDEGTGETIFYEIEPIEDEIGRLDDNSVRNDSSDFITYPFSPTKILFDDLATRVDNKKRHSDSLGFEYSGSPAIRPADFQELNLLGDIGVSDGPELVQNGTFDTDVSNWTAETSTITWSSGRLQTNRTGGSGYTSYQAIPTEIGRTYTVKCNIDSTGTGGRQDIRVLSDLSTNSGSILSTSPANGVSGSTVDVEVYFTATGTTSYVYTVSDGGGTGFFDNISVKLEPWLDQSGKGNDGDVAGATHNAAGYWEFDGADDFITTSFPSDAIATGDATSEYTLEAWIYVRSSSGTTTNADAIMGHNTDRGVGMQVGVSNGSPRINYGARYTSNFFGPTFNYNEWRHIVLTRDGTDGPIAYENGVEVSRTGSAADLEVETGFTPGDFNLGYCGPRIAGYFDGFIGEARVYTRALSAAQVFQNYNATKTKYILEAPDTAPKIGPGIVNDSNLLLNYDFGNRATYDTFANRFDNPTIALINSEIKTTASDGGLLHNFGYSVAVGSGKMVVGAYGNDAAYIYDLDGTNEVKITASDAAQGDRFGYSVAVGNSKIVVGARQDDDNGSASGSAYIYDLDGTNEVKITASDGVTNDFFGTSVAVGDDKIVVGAAAASSGNDGGSAYIYDLDGTNEVKITASDGASFDYFGESVAVGDGKIVVGAWGDGDNGFNSGAAYIYDLDGTNEVKITASDGAADEGFGLSVAVGNDRIVVGSYRDDNNNGSAYIFDLNGNQLSKITASDGASFDNFGSSVAVGDGRIVVGSRLDDDNGSASGSVYVYNLDGTNEFKITASDGADNDYFGSSVAVGSGKMVVGAYRADNNASSDGSAYIYSLKLPLPTTVKNLSNITTYDSTIPAAWSFNGSVDPAFDITDQLVLPTPVSHPNGHTWEIWVKINSYSSTANAYLFRAGTTTNTEGLYIQQSTTFDGQGSIWQERNDGSGASSTNVNLMPASDYIVAGEWNCIVSSGTTDNNHYMYFNGVLVSANANDSRYEPTQMSRIGGPLVDMKIGEARVYDRELSATEILQNFNATRSKYGV